MSKILRAGLGALITIAMAACGARAARHASTPDERDDARFHGSTASYGTSRRPSARAPGRSIAAGGAVALSSEETALSMTVERRQSGQGDYYLAAGFTLDEWVVRVTAFPSRYPGHLGLSLRSPLVRGHTYVECAVRVMANGSMLLAPEPAGVRVTGGATTGGYQETLDVIVPRIELATMASADRLVVRVCDTELRLGPEHRAVFTEMLLRFDEEERWLAADGDAGIQDLTPGDAGVGPAPSEASGGGSP